MRYSRQEKLDFIPTNFQDKIINKKIILVGCGGIGSPLGELLVRGGFLNLTLIDNDIIDETNLQRQIYFQEDIGKSKSQTLKTHLLKINKTAKIQVFNNILEQTNIDKICKNCDLIIDATDNFKTRKLINNWCIKNKKDWLYNGAIKTEIISSLFYGKNNLFEKVFPENVCDESCCQVGILASTTYASAALAYNQVLKYFINKKENKLIKIDLWKNKIFEIELE